MTTANPRAGAQGGTTAALPWAATDRRSGSREVSGKAPSESFHAADWPLVTSRFRLRQELGVGGMGTVYRAYDRELGYDVALKVLHRLTPSDRLRLKAEFRALANIVHPNLISLHELFMYEFTSFFTMELVLGVDFVTWARSLRPSGGADAAEFYASLRDRARQLVMALAALHADGKAHRDVKPSNVLVTEAGRVVLLDFGLSVPLQRPLDASAERAELAGTLEYMAPEQAWGGAVSPAADWYSLGVTLYEAITGVLPVSGRAFELAQRKSSHVPSSLQSQGLSIPAELDRLLMDLLQPSPERRPEAAQILELLGAESGRASHPPVAAHELRPPRIVDRDSERARFRELLRVAASGGTRVLHVQGSSGVGKSALIRSCLREPQGEPLPLVLCSRCHPREALAFNAIDGLVDELTRSLGKSFEEYWLEAPADARAALLRVFPGFGRAEALSASPEERSPARTSDVRRLAFLALRALLERLSASRPIVIWLDDVQWADEDSGTVLREILRPPVVPGLLLVLSCRSEDRLQSACLALLESSGRETDFPAQWVERIDLDRLSNDDSIRLVEQEFGEATLPAGSAVRRLMEECAGLPFLLCELARYLALPEGPPVPVEKLNLDDILRARTQALPDSVRVLLEVFSVAGAPLDQHVALRAAGFDQSQRALVTDLERLSILRTTDARQRTSEVYHHRIRDEVLRQLDPARRVRHHAALGEALLSSPSPNPLAAVEHFEAAGDLESVRRYVLAAASHAAAVLAFERAARLYERAIALGCGDVEPHELYRRLGVAFANAGRGKDAGLAFMKAAAQLELERLADSEQIVNLNGRAAEQFIQTGHYSEGMASLYAVFKELDVPFPRSRREALTKATALRLYSLLRGVRLPKARKAAPSARALQRFDALWSTNIRLAMGDYTFLSYASIRCALDAIELGDESRLICALALEGTASATLPGRRFQTRVDQLFGIARSLCSSDTPSYENAFVSAAFGVGMCFRGQFRVTYEHADQAIRMLAQVSRGARWEVGLWQMWTMIGLTHLGEVRELARRARAVREDGERREDRFTMQYANLGRPTLTWLAEDRPRHAIEQADLALTWAPSDYNSQHYQHYVSTTEAELYLGEVGAAWERSRRLWPVHAKNHFLMVQFVRDELLQARGRAALAKARALSDSRGPAEEAELRALLKVASGDGRELQRHGLACAEAWGELILAGVEFVSKRAAQAALRLRRAIELFETCEMKLYREGARYALGVVLGGDEGASLARAAERWMREQEIVKPDRMARMLAPGLVT